MITSRSVIALGIALLGSACSDVAPPTAQASASGAGGVSAGGMSASGASGGGLGGVAGTPSGGIAGAGAGAAGTGGVAGAGGVGGGGASGSAGAAGDTSLNQLAQAFHGFRMDLHCDHPQDQPCEPQNSATPNLGYLCCYVDQTIERKNHPPIDRDLDFGGEAGKLYDVDLRIRGVVENHDYGGQGTKQGDWVLVGGTRPSPGAIHVFGATTHDPEQTYFFNSWNDKADPIRMVVLDYVVTLQVRGGSKVRVFEYDDIGKIWANAGMLKVEGLPPYPDAIDGQFLQMDVVAVRVH